MYIALIFIFTFLIVEEWGVEAKKIAELPMDGISICAVISIVQLYKTVYASPVCFQLGWLICLCLAISSGGVWMMKNGPTHMFGV